MSDRIPTYGLFVDPPLGRVGMTEDEARAGGASSSTPDTKELLGAAILGVEGDEAIHAIADVMYAKGPCTVISRAVHTHPTVSELIPTTLQSLEPL